MLKRITATGLCMAIALSICGQQAYLDSLRQEAISSQSDTVKLVQFRTMARIYAEINPDSAYHYAERSLALARKMNLKLDEASALRELGYSLLNRGNYPRSLQLVLQSMSILENPKSEQKVLVGKFPGDDELMYRTGSPRIQRLSEIAFTHQIWGVLYANLNDYEKALYRHHQAIIRAEESGNIALQSVINMTMGRMYLNLKKTDSALYRLNKAYEQAIQTGYKRYTGSTLLNMGRVYSIMGNKLLANDYYRKSLVASAEHSYFRGVVASNHLLAEYYRQQSRKDSFFYHINAAVAEARNLDAPELLLRSYTSLANYYETTGNNDSAVKYLRLIIQINESSLSVKNAQQFQNIDFDEQQRQQEKEAAVKAYKIRLRMYALLSGLGIFLLVAIILWRNNRNRQRAYSLLIKQKQQTDFQKTKVEETLKELKLTQTQLIQSEKMASLGELTAGIAHEIQNPLNFVNNFSEVNTELIDELKQEIDKGNYEDVKSIAGSISDNEQKINHHGRRADAIVKSMLQHSRTSSGKKESTDINALVDEYLRLAYHGMRAKEKSFNIAIDSKFDEAIEPVNIIPQDIGRVVLNLITNAFYAINEKKKLNIEGYEPRIEVTTKKLADFVEIKVSDNGTGIPQKVLDKIFQPFFTTKPTGQGTGLGLSLSYDIIKTHGGELRVDTKEDEGTIFVIELPLKNGV